MTEEERALIDAAIAYRDADIAWHQAQMSALPEVAQQKMYVRNAFLVRLDMAIEKVVPRS